MSKKTVMLSVEKKGLQSKYVLMISSSGAVHVYVITRQGLGNFGSRIRTKKWLKENGVDLQVMSADVTNREDLQRVMDKIAVNCCV